MKNINTLSNKNPSILIETEKEKNLRISIETLKSWFPIGATVYFVLRYVSKSGVKKHISIVGMGKDYLVHPNYALSIVLNLPIVPVGLGHTGVVVKSSFNAAYDITELLSYALYKDNKSLRHEWI